MPVGNCTEEEVGYEVDPGGGDRISKVATIVALLGALFAIAGLVTSKFALAAAGALVLFLGCAALYHLRRRYGTKGVFGISPSSALRGQCGQTLEGMTVLPTPTIFTSGAVIRFCKESEVIATVEINGASGSTEPSCLVSYPNDASRPDDNVPVSLPLTQVDLYRGADLTYGVYLRS